MKEIWIVSIGLNWNAEQLDTKCFNSFQKAAEYVQQQFREDITTLEEYSNDSPADETWAGIKIGNTYEIKKMVVE